MDATKCVLPKDITIRVVNKTTGKVKNVFPAIANNKQLMKTSGHQIADPQYDAKMEAVKNNRPFIENGKAKEPVKESFAVPDTVEQKPIVEKTNNCCTGVSFNDECKADEPISNYGQSSVEVINKPKRTRRTKAQMEESKLNKIQK